MRIVQLANFVSPTSGGIRTTMDRLGAGYRAAGHQTALIIPGSRDARQEGPDGVVMTVGAPHVPRSGGYRMITDLRTVRRMLTQLAPDRIEVNDRFTLRAVGPWAQEQGIPAVVIVHERLDRLAAVHVPWLLRPATWARKDNAALADRFDRVVSPSVWGAQEFTTAEVDDVQVVRWGVDAQAFRPDRRSAVVRRRLLGDQQVLVAMVCRLSPEKNPGSAIQALVELRRRGVKARLVVAGTGQMEASLRRQAAKLDVTFLGHVSAREHVAELLACADVAICPGPIETFGLAALEALASGTPVVSSRSGAIPELLSMPYGRPAYNHGPSMASAAQMLLDEGPAARVAARAAAEAHPWSRSIQHMLHLHGLADRPDSLLNSWTGSSRCSPSSASTSPPPSPTPAASVASRSGPAILPADYVGLPLPAVPQPLVSDRRMPPRSAGRTAVASGGSGTARSPNAHRSVGLIHSTHQPGAGGHP